MSSKTVLYVGGFILPDKNAAAQRVVGIAKILRDIGYNVVFINKSPDGRDYNEWEQKDYFGFKCYEIKNDHSKKDIFNSLYDISFIKDIIEKEDPQIVIAYNYPAVALSRLNSYCKRHGMNCIGDNTEWYRNGDSGLVHRIIKGCDTEYRMRTVNRKLSGNIVISDYLEKYYSDMDNVVNIPPLVDKSEKKWNVDPGTHDGIRLIYAGSPSREKERLDIIYDAVCKLSEKYNVKLYVIGITEDQFKEIYDWGDKGEALSEAVVFLGRIPHEDVIKKVTEADYSILIRDNNLVNTAGFPTKFVESISCGTAVIANSSSCISKYFAHGNNGWLVDENKLSSYLEEIFKNDMHIKVEADLFDYHKYLDEVVSFINKVKPGNN